MRLTFLHLTLTICVVFSHKPSFQILEGSDEIPKDYAKILNLFCGLTTCSAYAKKNIVLGCLPGKTAKEFQCALKCSKRPFSSCPSTTASDNLKGFDLSKLMEKLKGIKEAEKNDKEDIKADINLDEWHRVEQTLVNKRSRDMKTKR